MPQSAAWRHTRSVCGVSPRCRRDRLLPAQPVEPWLLQRSRMRWRSQRSASVTSEFGKSPNRVTHGDTARLTPALGSCDSGRLAIYGSAARGRSTKGESHDQVLNRSTGPPLIRPVWAGPGWARVKPSRRCLAASVVQRDGLASHRSRRGPSKFGWREQRPAGRHRRDEGAPSPRVARAVGPAGGSRSAASAPRGALAIRALAAPNGPRGRRTLARQYPRR
jgi:hypothetical protein